MKKQIKIVYIVLILFFVLTVMNSGDLLQKFTYYSNCCSCEDGSWYIGSGINTFFHNSQTRDCGDCSMFGCSSKTYNVIPLDLIVLLILTTTIIILQKHKKEN